MTENRDGETILCLYKNWFTYIKQYIYFCEAKPCKLMDACFQLTD